MKVLLAGATGAIGIPITRQLLAHGHQVLGLTREPAGAGRIQALGAHPGGCVGAADAVIHELTALGKPPLRHSGMTLTNRLRTQGTTNLLAAAETLGARRFLTQSVVFGYGYRDHGPRPLAERDPFGRPAGDSCDPHVAAMLSTERQAFSAPRGSPCATACCTAATPPRCGPCWPGAGCPWPGAGCSAGSTTRTPPRPPWPPSSTAAPGRPTTSSTTCQPAGRRSTPPWRRRLAPHRRGGCRAGCCGWPRRTSPRRRRHLDARRQRQGQDGARLAAPVPDLPRRHQGHGLGPRGVGAMTGNGTERVSAVVVAVALLGFFAWVLLTLPIQPALILVVAGTLAWVGWVTTGYAHPVRSRKVIATYLCAVSFQLVHMAEEYTGGFPHEIVQLFHSSRPWSERSFLLTFVFGFGALWVLPLHRWRASRAERPAGVLPGPGVAPPHGGGAAG